MRAEREAPRSFPFCRGRRCAVDASCADGWMTRTTTEADVRLQSELEAEDEQAPADAQSPTFFRASPGAV